MNLTTARVWVRQSARNAQSSDMYSDADVDRAILSARNHFLSNTLYLRKTSTVEIEDGNSTVGPFPAGFFPERLLRAWISTGLEKVDYFAILDLVSTKNETGTPTKLAFIDHTRAVVYPTPDRVYTLNILFSPPGRFFNPGTAMAESIDMEAPDHHMMKILELGAPAILQRNEPEHASFVQQAQSEFNQYIAQVAGTGFTDGNRYSMKRGE
jgi:hypothetical protein